MRTKFENEQNNNMLTEGSQNRS